VLEPIVSGGKLVKDDEGNVVMIRRYSDNLLAMLLRAHSSKFRTAPPSPPLMPWEMSDDELNAAIEACKAHVDGAARSIAAICGWCRRPNKLGRLRRSPAGATLAAANTLDWAAGS